MKWTAATSITGSKISEDNLRTQQLIDVDSAF